MQALKDLSSELDFPDGIDNANQATMDFTSVQDLMRRNRLVREFFLDMRERIPHWPKIAVIRVLQNENIQASEETVLFKEIEKVYRGMRRKGIEELEMKILLLYYVKYLYHRSYACCNY